MRLHAGLMGRRRGRIFVGALLAVSVIGALAIGSAEAGSHREREPQARTAASALRLAGTFVSLVPACGCGRSEVLERFAVSDGRRLGRLASVPVDGFQVATPASTSHGRLFVTMTRSGRCSASGYAACPHWVAGSCRNEVQTLAPGGSRLQLAFDVTGSVRVGEVVPSPDGGRVALAMTPCVSAAGTAGMYITGANGGRARAVMSATNVCDAYGPAAWNATGSEIAFPYEPAGGRPVLMAGGFGCPEGPRNYLVIASTDAGVHRRTLVKAGRTCVFEAVAFDSAGLLAAEGCSHGSPKRQFSPNLGDAFLMQYSTTGHLQRSMALERGLEQAVLSTAPGTGDVLVTQDRPANEPYPEEDLVWEFDGKALRLIARYRAEDAAQVLAVAW